LEIMRKNPDSIDFVEDRKGHDLRYSLDYSKIQTKLGFQPEISFEEGLRSTIAWYQRNENWWLPLKS
jgi:dTDP-glucose 4,6-dehydratase